MGIHGALVTTQTMLKELDSKFSKMHQRLVALDDHVNVSGQKIRVYLRSKKFFYPLSC